MTGLPFEHTPRLRAVSCSVVPLAVMTAVGVTFAAIGLVGLRQRDIG